MCYPYSISFPSHSTSNPTTQFHSFHPVHSIHSVPSIPPFHHSTIPPFHHSAHSTNITAIQFLKQRPQRHILLHYLQSILLGHIRRRRRNPTHHPAPSLPHRRRLHRPPLTPLLRHNRPIIQRGMSLRFHRFHRFHRFPFSLLLSASLRLSSLSRQIAELLRRHVAQFLGRNIASLRFSSLFSPLSPLRRFFLHFSLHDLFHSRLSASLPIISKSSSSNSLASSTKSSIFAHDYFEFDRMPRYFRNAVVKIRPRSQPLQFGQRANAFRFQAKAVHAVPFSQRFQGKTTRFLFDFFAFLLRIRLHFAASAVLQQAVTRMAQTFQ